MRPLPKVPFAGRLCRVKSDEPFEVIARRAATSMHGNLEVDSIEGTKWLAFWLLTTQQLISSGTVTPEEDGTFAYPFLLRAVDDRILLVGRDGTLTNLLLERGGVGGWIESPRIQVDRFARDLIVPTQGRSDVRPQGRKYLIGSIYAAVEGYGRSLRTQSFFGDDLAEAELVRRSLSEITVTRIGIRDPRIDKDLLSISTIGEVDFRFRGTQHLNSIDQLTSHMRSHGYIEWREGASWEPEPDQSAVKAGGKSPRS